MVARNSKVWVTMNSTMASDAAANGFGAILGGMLVVYLIGRLLEIILLKRVISSFTTKVFSSAAIVFLGVALLWLSSRGKPYGTSAFNGATLFFFFVAAVLVPLLRSFLHKRRVARRGHAIERAG